jgi:hypothetical protein
VAVPLRASIGGRGAAVRFSVAFSARDSIFVALRGAMARTARVDVSIQHGSQILRRNPWGLTENVHSRQSDSGRDGRGQNNESGAELHFVRSDCCCIIASTEEVQVKTVCCRRVSLICKPADVTQMSQPVGKINLPN